MTTDYKVKVTGWRYLYGDVKINTSDIRECNGLDCLNCYDGTLAKEDGFLICSHCLKSFEIISESKHLNSNEIYTILWE